MQLMIPQESYSPNSNHFNTGKVRNAFIVKTYLINKGNECVCVCALVRLSQYYQTVFTPPGMARSSITDSSSFANTGGLHPCETLTHAVITATGLQCYYRLNNCQITMAACRLELTPCRRSLAKAFRKKNKQRLSLLHSVLLHPQVSVWQLRRR